MKKSELRQIIREEIRKVINEVQVGPYTNAISAGNLKPGMNVSLIGVRDKLEHIGIIQGIKPKVTKGQYGNFYEYTIEYKNREGEEQVREFIQDDYFVEHK